jgi:hypothetical protein
MSDAAKRAAWGRIGGLTAWAKNEQATLVGPAHHGFRRRFERLVDPEGILDTAERVIRADRARRAYMLQLAQKSADVRRARASSKAGPSTLPPSLEGRRTEGEPAYRKSAREADPGAKSRRAADAR